MHCDIIGKQVDIKMGTYPNLSDIIVTILEQVGNGFLVRSESGKYCCVHYDFCGKLHTIDLFDSLIEARNLAEKTQYRMS